MVNVGDGIVDCDDGSDELIFLHDRYVPVVVPDVVVYPCPTEWTLCNSYREECVPNYKLCVFERTIFGDPLYCSDTEHLKNCVDHVCPNIYKCHKSYCIPLYMLCDNINDCPDNEDEKSCPIIKCTGLLKCKGNSISKSCYLQYIYIFHIVVLILLL